MNLSILYRGPLASCNYDCSYCPFAKRRDMRAQLDADRAALTRFVAWVRANPDGDHISILFTPWGEGLTRSWYRTALVDLSHLPQVGRVAIQTNLAGPLRWAAAADPSRIAFWATYHPGQTSHERFLANCDWLIRHGIRFSVGVVGLPDHFAAAAALRTALPPDVYLWVNAAEGHEYHPADEARWTDIDPLFGFSVRPHASAGHECWAGETAISVNGDGDVRRCHFIATPLGNLYDGSYRAALGPAPCPKAECDCHIGYVHLKKLNLYQVYGPGVLERIPIGRGPLWGVPLGQVSASGV
jgi:hypothetical protein